MATRRASSGVDVARTQHADLVRRRMHVRGQDLVVAGGHPGRPAHRDVLARSSRRARPARPRVARQPPARRRATISRTCCANARNSSFDETGSVSQPTATIVPIPPSTRASTTPSVVSRSDRLPAAAIPFSRSSFCAASTSPPVSSSARLQSIIPAPGQVAELLDEARSDGAHAGSSVVAASGCSRAPARRRARARLRRCLGVGSGSGTALPRRRARAPAAAVSAARSGADAGLREASAAGSAAAAASSRPVARSPRAAPRRRRDVEPAAMPSAMTRTTRLQDADRVVVAGDHEVGVVGVAVRVHETDDRDVQPPCLAHRQLLLAQIDQEDGVGQPLHLGDPAEVDLELLELGEHADPLLGGEQLELALVTQAPQLVQPLDALRDRAPVGEQAAEPAMVDVGHADARRLLLDRRPEPASSCRRTARCRRARRCCARTRAPARAAPASAAGR